jgi:hypothetical protein
MDYKINFCVSFVCHNCACVLMKLIIVLYPGTTHNLESLKMILSTGSPLMPQSYDYVYREIKQDLLLGSITGKFYPGKNKDLCII